MNRPAKRAVNLRIDESLIDQAKAMDINLSQTLEASLVEVLREKQRAAWLAETLRTHRPRVPGGIFPGRPGRWSGAGFRRR